MSTRVYGGHIASRREGQHRDEAQHIAHALHGGELGKIMVRVMVVVMVMVRVMVMVMVRARVSVMVKVMVRVSVRVL